MEIGILDWSNESEWGYPYFGQTKKNGRVLFLRDLTTILADPLNQNQFDHMVTQNNRRNSLVWTVGHSEF